MTDILNTLANDGSDNEDIKKLFPKCKPKALGDINLNKLRADIDKLAASTHSGSRSYANHADGAPPATTNGHRGRDSNGNVGGVAFTSGDLGGSNNPLLRRHWIDDPMLNSLVFAAGQTERALPRDVDRRSAVGFKGSSGRPTNATTPADNTANTTTRSANPEIEPADYAQSPYRELEEDYSVLSAYAQHNMDRNSTHHHHQQQQPPPQQHHGHTHHHRISVSERPTALGHVPSPPLVDDEVVYDSSLDIGYRVPVMREEFRLRESRIEIAGGREVFSSSRSRPAKKRFSDEILYHHRPTDKDLKRHSGEVLYDEQASRYHVKSAAANSNRSGDDFASPIAGAGSNSGGWSPDERQPTRRHQHPNKALREMEEVAAAAAARDRGGSGGGQQDVDGYYAPSSSGNDHGQGQAGSSRHSPKETFILKGQRSGMFIYETVVCGTSEVVYDDIGDWNGQQRALEEERDHHQQQQQRRNSYRHQSSETAGPASSEPVVVMGGSYRQDVGGGIVGGGMFQRSLNASTEAINSEDPMSEREDGGGSSQEDTRNHAPQRGIRVAGKGEAEEVVDVVAVAARGAEHLSSSDDMDDTESAQSSPDRKPVAKLIGNLPIAQYEGSPRRYGPRPGHPQRITDVEALVTVVTEPQPPPSISMESNVDPVIANGGSGHLVQSSVDANGQCAPPAAVAVDESEIGKGDPGSLDGFPFPLTDYNYLYEESETRKVLEEFYRQDGLCTRLREGGTLTAEEFRELEYRLYRVNTGNSYVGRRLAQSFVPEVEDSPKKKPPAHERMQQLREHILASSLALMGGAASAAAAAAAAPTEAAPTTTSVVAETRTREATLSKENIFNFNLDMPLRSSMQLRVAADQDGETVSTNPDTEDLGETEIGEQVGQSRNFTLSPETTECDSSDVESEVSLDHEGSLHSSGRQYNSMPVLEDGLSSGHASEGERERPSSDHHDQSYVGEEGDREAVAAGFEGSLATLMMKKQISEIEREIARRSSRPHKHGEHHHHHHHHQQPFQQPHVQPSPIDYREVEEYLRRCDSSRTQQETDIDLEMLERLRTDSQGTPPPPAPHAHRRPSLHDASLTNESVSNAINEIKQAIRKTKTITLKSPHMEKAEEDKPVWVMRPSYKSKDGRSEGDGVRDKSLKNEEGRGEDDECDTDQETDRLLGKQRADDTEFFDDKEKEAQKKKGRTKEVLIHEPAVLIEGVLFRARYLGSTQLACEGQPTKATRMMQAEEAVSRIKAPDGETQPSTEVDLFISTEKIMVLNTDLKEIMMDHALRTISYIADIGDLVVLMARRRMVSPMEDPDPKIRRSPKMICHVFESEEAQFIAQSIGQAFQVAYMEFLKANGIEDHSFVKEMDYQEVLNSQEIFGDELEMFAKKEMQKEVIVPKLKGEILGVVIVESGWGSMLPTVVIANLSPSGAAARCGQLNIGDQIIAINGISLVGLPLSTCQNYIKNTKNQTVVKLTVVPCAPVVEVKIKRPDTKYQLGFSVQNGVICSLLRGGIAERGGVRVGHRIIEINGQSVVAVPHERIVNLLATSVGEIHMKTMPTSMFRLLTGQEAPLYI